MNEELRERARDILKQQYDEQRVVEEPELPHTSARPDFGIRLEDSRDLLVLVNVSSMRTRHRRHEDIESLKRMMEKADVTFGALISDDVEYIFELTQFDGERVEREIPDYPDSRKSEFEEMLSAKELEFRLWRATDNLRGHVSEGEYHYHLFHALFRKWIAQEEGNEVDTESIDEEWLNKKDAQISDRFPAYSPNVAPKEIDVQRQILRAFQEIDLTAIQPRAAQAFIELVESSRSASESMTPIRVAEALVDLARPVDGDSFLDPAGGIGNVAREAARRGADVSVVDINPEIVNCGLFLSAVHDVEVTYTVADFLEITQFDDSRVPNDLEKIVIDPPFGLHYERSDGTRIENAEELIIREALGRLKSGGSVTVAVPQGSLFKKKWAEFRELITNEYRLETIIEVNKPVFHHTATPTAIIKIVNEPANSTSEVKYEIVSESDAEEGLAKAVEKILTGSASTFQIQELRDGSFLPSEIIGRQEVINQLHNKYGQVNILELGERSRDIRSGVNPSEKLSDPNQEAVPFLRPRDVNKESPEDFVRQDEVGVTAGVEDVLISVKGSPSVVHVPTETIVPSSSWAIVRFESRDVALVYGTFIDSELGREQLDMMRSGSTIPYISLRRLRELLVPDFTETEVAGKASQIRELREDIKEHERQREALEDEMEDIV